MLISNYRTLIQNSLKLGINWPSKLVLQGSFLISLVFGIAALRYTNGEKNLRMTIFLPNEYQYQTISFRDIVLIDQKGISPMPDIDGMDGFFWRMMIP